MFDYLTLYQVQYILIILIYLNERLEFKYIKNKDILLNKLLIQKYDKKHSLSILYLLFNIQIYTITESNKRIIYIYYENAKLSKSIIINEKIIDDSIKVVLSLYYLDKYYITNLLEIYNCGIVTHTNYLFKHSYNYMGIRREEFNKLKN